MTDFSSIDRLVEFGLGLGLAQQMIKTMNYSIGNMIVPGADVNFNQIPTVKYFAIINNAQVGPLNQEELQEMIGKYLVEEDTLVWSPGLNSWKFAKDVPSVYKLILLRR